MALEEFETYQDVSIYSVGDQRREALLRAGRECAVVWSTKDGWPVGVMHLYLWREGSFWVTCTERRKRVAALRARPQSSIIVAAEREQTVTAKTLATVHGPDSGHRAWFYPAVAEMAVPSQMPELDLIPPEAYENFIRGIDTPDRVIIEFQPVKWISFDGRKVVAHVRGQWDPSRPWIEP
jgi:hypothetical protein